MACAAAACFDVRRGSIPDALTWSTFGLSLVLRLAIEGPGSLEQGLVSGLLGAVACAAPFGLLALSGPRVGVGDVKLLAAAGAGLGIPRALTAVMLVSVVGAVVALTTVWWRRRSLNSGQGPRKPVDTARSIPYGVPIAVGVCWAMAWAGPMPGAVPETGEQRGLEVEVTDAGAEDEAFDEGRR